VLQIGMREWKQHLACLGSQKIQVISLLVVEPDYLPDSEVFYFQLCLYPMKYLHPRSMYTLPRGGVQRGGTPSAGSGGGIPPVGGKQGFGGEAPEGKIAL
jgi:hypothetical protein